MNKKQKGERARKWIDEINVSHEIIDGAPVVDESWKDIWVKVLVDAPEKIFAQSGFYEVVELYAWKEIVKQNLGDTEFANEQMLKLMGKLTGVAS
ncbi:MAG TPA: hypothetical protein VLK33_00985 [Terriglobales bacterium]|nr:hypothetical protein [Terriglobales bacterium]